jgi:hypothetical protein
MGRPTKSAWCSSPSTCSNWPDLTFLSTFLPRWLGVLVALGAGWLVFLYPPLARVSSRYTALASIGEVLLVLWLAVKGVDEERWHEQAGSNLRAYGQSA